MLKWMRERLSRDEGFTLIELMVVVLIIAILIAIAIPSFLGFRKNAQDRSAQADLRSVLLAEKAYYTENSVFTTTIADLQTIEPNVNTGVTLSSASGVVCMELQSDGGDYFAVWESATAATAYGKDAATMVGTCPGTTPSWTAW
jgi:type IV pilus assembly protein PilA